MRLKSDLTLIVKVYLKTQTFCNLHKPLFLIFYHNYDDEEKYMYTCGMIGDQIKLRYIQTFSSHEPG